MLPGHGGLTCGNTAPVSSQAVPAVDVLQPPHGLQGGHHFSQPLGLILHVADTLRDFQVTGLQNTLCTEHRLYFSPYRACRDATTSPNLSGSSCMLPRYLRKAGVAQHKSAGPLAASRTALREIADHASSPTWPATTSLDLSGLFCVAPVEAGSSTFASPRSVAPLQQNRLAWNCTCTR